MIYKKKFNTVFFTILSFAIYAQKVNNKDRISQKPVFPGCENKEKKELDQCNRKVSYYELLQRAIYSKDIFEKVQKEKGGMIVNVNISKKGKITLVNISDFFLSKNVAPIIKAGVPRMFQQKKVYPAKIKKRKVNYPYTIYIEFPIMSFKRNLTSEEIWDELEMMKSPAFDSLAAQKFSDNYVKFMRGIISGFYLKDGTSVNDWELFFKTQQLNNVPNLSQISTNDRYKLNYILNKAEQIKKSIKK